MTEFSDALKTWRAARRLSQLDLAMAADVSARHISFLESARARPSREMVARLGEALQLPLPARNEMLTRAGFAAVYPSRGWDDAEMAPVRAAVAHTLERHAPYPALALDRLWTVLRLNRPAARLFGALGVGEGDSLLDLMESAHLPPLVENWPQVAHRVAARLRAESAARGGVGALDRTAAVLEAVRQPKPAATGPVLPTILRLGGLRLSLFATIAQFGTPEDVTLDDMKIELYFPADEATGAWLRQAEGPDQP